MRGTVDRRARRATTCVGLLAVLALAAPGHAQDARTSSDRGPAARGLIAGTEPPAPRASDGRIEYGVSTTTTPVAIDGVLDDEAWASAVVVPLMYEVSPAENGIAPVATECRLTHDREHLYLGCIADDPRPEGIRAFVSDRDGIDAHDRIEMTLDPFNDQRRAFRFSVSALGVQADAVFAQQGTGDPNGGPDAAPIDPSWDAIWNSAGVITERGYVVEAAIPFRSLRFPRTDEAGGTWGVYLSRWWPRSSNVELRSAMWDRGDSCVLCQANVLTGVRGGAPGVNLQLTPTFTSARTERRATGADPLVADPTRTDFGMDAQWGLTSDLTLNLTANPDFSQVEADVAQLDVNNQFALFFPEKRPFFLEGADFFGTPIRTVFTRSIADPMGGAKVTGKLGASAAGVLVARDRVNNLLIPGSDRSGAARLDDDVTTAVARFRHDVGATSTVGAIYTGREGAGYHNRVGGFDAFYRPVPALTVQAQVLESTTRYPDAVTTDGGEATGPFGGGAARLSSNFATTNWTVNSTVLRVEPGFRADAGFVPRAGILDANLNVSRRWWGGADRWFTQLRVQAGTWHIRDFDGLKLDGGMWLGLHYQGPWQTSIDFWPNLFIEQNVAGRAYPDRSQYFFGVGTAPSGSWRVRVNGNFGDAIDFANNRPAEEVRISPSLESRLGRNVELTLQHTWQRLENGGAPVFTAHLSQLRTVYNFSARSFLRAIVQYRRTDRDPSLYVDPVDRRSEGVFAQLLYSYKVNPQTVFFVGYSQDGAGATDIDLVHDPIAVRGRTLFVKFGYAWRP